MKRLGFWLAALAAGVEIIAAIVAWLLLPEETRWGAVGFVVAAGLCAIVAWSFYREDR